MSHPERTDRCTQSAFPPVSRLVFLLIAALAAGPALAAEDAGLAFVLGPGSHLTLGSDVVPLPVGARLELLVSGKKTGGRFPIQVKPGGLVLPEIDLGKDGQRLRVRVTGAPTGYLTPQADGLAAELAATVQVELGDGIASSAGEYALALTTATESKGGKIDYASRSARLVAASTIAADSPVAPGEPLRVVLEGAFEGLPADLR
jgi:hypothetical protein